MEDEVHFLFQCPQYNLLRNEYNIPFINIYDFNKRSFKGVQHYVKKFVSDLRQVGGFLRIFRFPPPIKLIATI